MRAILLSLALVAAPAAAQATAKPATPPVDTTEVVRALNDPATSEKLTRMMQALSKAFLNLPVGEVEAAVEGRPATPAERQRTLRDVGRQGNPNFERDFNRDIAQSRAAMQAGMKAMAAALPAMTKALSEAAREMDKALANMPSPSYPKR